MFSNNEFWFAKLGIFSDIEKKKREKAV